MRGRGLRWSLGLVVVALSASGWASAQYSNTPAVAACRQGKEAGCRNLGYEKKAAKEIASLLKKQQKGAAEIAKKPFSEAALAGVAWLSPFPEVARAALGKVTNPALIADVTLRSADLALRKEAIAKLTDGNQLARIAAAHFDRETRLAAVERMTDGEQLAAALGKTNYQETRLAILRKLTDQKRLASLALTLRNSDERVVAVSRLSDSALLAEVALKSQAPAVAKGALARITDQNALLEIVRKSRDLDLRRSAVERITDPEMALEVAAKYEPVELRSAALEKITDDPQLLRVIRESQYADTRQAAFTKLRDRSGLVGIMAELTDDTILAAAVSLTTDRATLEKVVSAPGLTAARWAALSRMAQLSPSQPLPDVPVRTFKNSIGMSFVWIDPRRFRMGDEESSFDAEKPSHTVVLSEGYYLQTTEVTQAQWEAVMGGNPSAFKAADRPVENVSWEDAVEFLKRLNLKEQGAPYRLPTEAEWECACRAGGLEPKNPKDANAVAWWEKNSGGESHQVGQKKANAWGLFDVQGNVDEWLADRYDPKQYVVGARVDPQGSGDGEARAVRGGSWSSSAESLGCANRAGRQPGYRNSNLGFRCARSW
jgi:formylglycine-generating enzyme required for sulfatase activity